MSYEIEYVDVWLQSEQPVKTITTVYASAMPIGIRIKDWQIPQNPVLLVTGKPWDKHDTYKNKDDRATANAGNNTITIIPEEGLFLPGMNWLQISIKTKNSEPVKTFRLKVKCDMDNGAGDVSEPEVVRGYAERAEEAKADAIKAKNQSEAASIIAQQKANELSAATADVATLKQGQEALKEDLTQFVAQVPFGGYGWEQGSINTDSGADVSTYRRVRTPYLAVTPASVCTFEAVNRDAYVFSVFGYDSNRGYKGRVSLPRGATTMTIPMEVSLIRIVAGYYDDSTETPHGISPADMTGIGRVYWRSGELFERVAAAEAAAGMRYATIDSDTSYQIVPGNAFQALIKADTAADTIEVIGHNRFLILKAATGTTYDVSVITDDVGCITLNGTNSKPSAGSRSLKNDGTLTTTSTSDDRMKIRLHAGVEYTLSHRVLGGTFAPSANINLLQLVDYNSNTVIVQTTLNNPVATYVPQHDMDCSLRVYVSTRTFDNFKVAPMLSSDGTTADKAFCKAVRNVYPAGYPNSVPVEASGEITFLLGNTPVNAKNSIMYAIGPVKSMANVADYVVGRLDRASSAQVQAALDTALQVSSTVYFPAGRYDFHVVVNRDCDIYMDKDCVIAITDNRTAAFTVIGHSVQFHGGRVAVGDSNFVSNFVTTIKKQTQADTEDYQHRPLMPGGDAARGIIQLTDCHNVGVHGLKVDYCQAGSVISVLRCHEVVIDNLDVNYTLLSAIHLLEHCTNVAVRDSVFRHMYPYTSKFDSAGNISIGPTYSYAIYTGIPNIAKPCHDASGNPVAWDDEGAIPYEPIDGYTVENCRFEDSFDSTVDTHGARNVIFRNNTFINCRTAITAYSDGRVPRPNGWRMENILIENNHSDWNRNSWYPLVHDYETIWGDNAVTEPYKHPHVFLGLSMTTSNGYSSWGRKYEGYCNCVVRNNHFSSPNNGDTSATSWLDSNGTIYLHHGGKNIVIENNVLDGCPVGKPTGYSGNKYQAQLALFARNCFGLTFRGNTLSNYGEYAPVQFAHSTVTVGGNCYEQSKRIYRFHQSNIGGGVYRPSSYTHIANVEDRDALGEVYSIPLLYNFAEPVWLKALDADSEPIDIPDRAYFCRSYGLCANNGTDEYPITIGDHLKSATVTVATNGLCTFDTRANVFVPGQRITLRGNGLIYDCTITDAISETEMLISIVGAKRTQEHSFVAGAYNLECRQADIVKI